MNPSDVGDDVAGMVTDHAWVALVALLVGLVVRLLKSDVPLPVTVPPRWRPWLALALGLLGGILDHAADGQPWPSAIAGGLAAGMLAIVGHDTVIESLRGGRELLDRTPPDG